MTRPVEISPSEDESKCAARFYKTKVSTRSEQYLMGLGLTKSYFERRSCGAKMPLAQFRWDRNLCPLVKSKSNIFTSPTTLPPSQRQVGTYDPTSIKTFWRKRCPVSSSLLPALHRSTPEILLLFSRRFLKMCVTLRIIVVSEGNVPPDLVLLFD